MDDFPSVTGRIHPNDRYLAVSKYLFTGSTKAVAKLFGVTQSAISHAKTRTKWWAEMEEEQRLEMQTVNRAQLRRTIVKSLTVIEDRLDNGDTVIDAEGQPRSSPVKCRDAAITFSILNQHQTKANQGPAMNVSIDLAQLAQQFAALAQGGQSVNTVQTVDGSLLKLPGRGKADPV